MTGRVVVIDCVTLWGTNFFFDNESNVERSLQELKDEFDRLTKQEAFLIFVTNEIGLGGVSPIPFNANSQTYRDGLINISPPMQTKWF